MASTMLDDSPTSYCRNCKKDIPKQNYDIHEIHCRRNLRLCKKCEEPFPISEMDEHMDEYHALVECKCKVKVEKSQLEKHEKEDCNHRMIQCKFCEMSLKFIDLFDHEHACGSRTEPCEKCGNYIMIRDAPTHRCSQIKPRQRETRNLMDEAPCEFLGDSFGFDSNPVYSYNNSIAFGSRSEPTNSRNFNRWNRFEGAAAEDVSMQVSNASRGSQLPRPRGGAQPTVVRGRRVITKIRSKESGLDSDHSDNVDVDLEDLNLDSAASKQANGKTTAKRQGATERGESRNNRLNNSRPSRAIRAKQSERTDSSNIGLGVHGRRVQGRSVQTEAHPPRLPVFHPVDLQGGDVCADGASNRGSRRKGGPNRRRQARETNRESGNESNPSSTWRDIPIKIDDDSDQLSAVTISSNAELQVKQDTVEIESESFQIPCEICDVLVNMADLEIHQQQCLLEQQQALQTFRNQIPVTEPAKIEKIVIDDRPDENTSIPCEFCEEVFPIDSVILHQPYCDMNPQRQCTTDQMDIPVTNTPMPSRNQNPSRGFWQSRSGGTRGFIEGSINQPPFDVFNDLTDSASYRRRDFGGHVDVDNDDIMTDDMSEPEDESPAARSRQRHWP